MRQVAGGASKFGLDCARCLRRKPPCRNDVWYLNEVVVTIARQKALVVARRRPGWICAGRNRAKPPQHQGRQALADAAVEEAGARAEAHDHRLAALVWSGKATGDAGRQAPVAQGVEQRSGEFPCAAAKTGADDAEVRSPGGLQRFVSTLSALRNLFVPPQTFCSRHTCSSPQHDGAGDITTRLYRSTYATGADAVTSFVGRVSSDGTGDNYRRPQSIAQTKALLGVGTMANRSVTISAAAPSGGVDGDFWVQP